MLDSDWQGIGPNKTSMEFFCITCLECRNKVDQGWSPDLACASSISPCMTACQALTIGILHAGDEDHSAIIAGEDLCEQGIVSCSTGLEIIRV